MWVCLCECVRELRSINIDIEYIDFALCFLLPRSMRGERLMLLRECQTTIWIQFLGYREGLSSASWQLVCGYFWKIKALANDLACLPGILYINCQAIHQNTHSKRRRRWEDEGSQKAIWETTSMPIGQIRMHLMATNSIQWLNKMLSLNLGRTGRGHCTSRLRRLKILCLIYWYTQLAIKIDGRNTFTHRMMAEWKKRGREAGRWP